MTAEKLLQPWRIHPYGDGGADPDAPDAEGYVTRTRKVRYKPDSNV
jgi:hypothetical protein